MATVVDRSTAKRTTKIIGRAWFNEVAADAEENAGVKYLTIKLNRGMQLSLDDSDRLTLWPNDKREGINPRTNVEFADADFNLGVSQFEEEAA